MGLWESFLLNDTEVRAYTLGKALAGLLSLVPLVERMDIELRENGFRMSVGDCSRPPMMPSFLRPL